MKLSKGPSANYDVQAIFRKKSIVSNTSLTAFFVLLRFLLHTFSATREYFESFLCSFDLAALSGFGPTYV